MGKTGANSLTRFSCGAGGADTQAEPAAAGAPARKKRPAPKPAGRRGKKRKSTSSLPGDTDERLEAILDVVRAHSRPNLPPHRIDWMRTQIRNKENADIFAEAVDPEVYPDYYAVISTPMDISQISDKIQVSEASLFFCFVLCFFSFLFGI